MKRRFADARDSRDILDCVYKNFKIDDEDFAGNISTLEIKKIRNKWQVDERCILNTDYIWLEIYPDGKNYCITAMCDEIGTIKEWYFDICKKTGVEDGVPYEDDLFLDVVIVPDGRIHILDEDELLEAFNNGEINKEELDLAYKTKDLILNQYSNNIEYLTKLTNKYKQNLLGIS